MPCFFAGMSPRDIILILVAIAFNPDHNVLAVENEDFGSDRDCPFLCTCAGYDVNCTNTNFFPDSIPAETERIFLTNSTFEYIRRNAFLNLHNLQEIHFIYCKIVNLPACSFAELENMMLILFENTEIDQIEGNAFSNLFNVSSITFAGVSIGQMRSFAFHNIKNVSRLEFFDTNISTIHPFAFLNIQNVQEISIMHSTIQKFLRDGFSTFSNVDLIYMRGSVIHEWQCGSLDTIATAGSNMLVFNSRFTCDCKLAWIWTNQINTTFLFITSNTCTGTNATLISVDINQMCPSEKSRDQGCPPLLPSTPHTCSRSFDSPKQPLEKITYPSYFSRKPVTSSATTGGHEKIFVYIVIILFQLWHLFR